MIKTKTWVILLAVLLAASCLACVLLFLRPATGTVAVVSLDGKTVYSVDLAAVQTPFDYEITSEYGTNTLHIEPGRICVSDADCADGVCIRSGWLQRSAPIVCLPHRLVIRLVSETESSDGFDAVSS